MMEKLRRILSAIAAGMIHAHAQQFQM